MSSEILFSLDRIEDEVAVLVDDCGASQMVPLSDLPCGACEGNMYRMVGGQYVEVFAAAEERRERIRTLQKRLRGQNK